MRWKSRWTQDSLIISRSFSYRATRHSNTYSNTVLFKIWNFGHWLDIHVCCFPFSNKDRKRKVSVDRHVNARNYKFLLRQRYCNIHQRKFDLKFVVTYTLYLYYIHLLFTILFHCSFIIFFAIFINYYARNLIESPNWIASREMSLHSIYVFRKRLWARRNMLFQMAGVCKKKPT